jgi:2-polyprenyl-3-methyl-5-hydroxy-6-metoxy-1,4-benzoquinol methylase
MIDKNYKREFEADSEKKCPICSLEKTEFIIKKYDDRFGQPDNFDYCFCSGCEIAFLENKIKKERMADLYGKYYVTGVLGKGNSSLVRKLIEKIGFYEIIINKLGGNRILLEDAKKESRVLEIGSGFSEKIKNIIIKKKLKWKGLEADEDAISKIKQAGLEVYYGTIDAVKIEEKFDLIILSQAIEHQYDINDFLLTCKKILNPEGSIIFTTPNFNSIYRKKYKERWINWHAPYHNILLSRKGINKLSEKHGYKIKKYHSFTPTSWYFLQKNFKLPKRGEKNDNFNFNFPLLPQLFVSLFLRTKEFFLRNENDCIYCKLKLKNSRKN